MDDGANSYMVIYYRGKNMINLRVLLCFLFISTRAFAAANPYLYSAVDQRSPFDTTQEQSNAVDKDHLTLNFQDIPVRAALNIITRSAGINSAISDSIKGNITLHLKDIPWQEALDIVLKTKGLSKLYLDQVLLIAPSDEIAARQKAALELQQQVQELEPLQTTVIILNYAKAEDLVSIIKDKSNSLLSDRGSVTVDKRTNALLLNDTSETIDQIRALIEKLDLPVKQVLIEARIVEVSRDFERTLGIRWGISKADHLSGTLEGASGIQQNLATGKSAFDTTNVSPLSRLNVNLPAQPSSGQAASMGIALANLGNGYLLDLELSALESEGQGELISSPRLVTADQQEAFIEAGEEIPYQETASSGTTTVAFKQATLKLDVTPHITPDNNIIMAIKVNQDKPNTALDVQGTPAITTRKIDTKVRVANGETVVLGGIYRQEKTHSILRVPFWGSLPVVGALFRSTKVTDSRGELLIFITPKIVQPDNAGAMIK
jgi:type IV pilus assembly protein PilQ